MEKNDFKILDDMQEIVLIENEVGMIKYVNKAFCKCHGVTPEEAVGRSCFEFIIPEDRERCNMEQIVTPENPYYRIEGRSKRIDGKIIWLQYVGRAYFDETGKRTEFQEIGVDITRWKEKIEESARSLAEANGRLSRAFEHGSREAGNKSGMNSKNGKFPAAYQFSDIHTANAKMKSVISYARAVAAGSATILIEGESGTGKELFAQSIHNGSKRANGPFVAINCGVIPAELIGSELFGYVEGAFTGASKGGKAGKFELASGGTLFLDEIGEMPLQQQVAFLRVLESRSVSRIGDDKEIPVDVRIVCATNKKLYQEVKEGKFRSDLYYRLNVINLHIPPLRERKEDIYLLIGAFIKEFGSHRFNKDKAFNDKRLMAFYKYDWPGNVRELQNVVERLIYMPEQDNETFFEYLIEDLGYTGEKGVKEERQDKQQDEKQKIMDLMETYEGNISMIARKMDISRNTLYKRLKKYHIKY